MKLDVYGTGQSRTLQLSGTLVLGRGDAVLRSSFDEQLGAGHRLLVLDLSRVSYLDSAGVGELVACAKKAAERGCVVKIAATPGGKVRQILQVTGLDRAFEIFDNDSAARASFEL